jgi:hypothetical protein
MRRLFLEVPSAGFWGSSITPLLRPKVNTPLAKKLYLVKPDVNFKLLIQEKS